jgi:hypothetical protein
VLTFFYFATKIFFWFLCCLCFYLMQTWKKVTNGVANQ